MTARGARGRTRGQRLRITMFSRVSHHPEPATHAGVHTLDRSSFASAPQRAIDMPALR